MTTLSAQYRYYPEHRAFTVEQSLKLGLACWHQLDETGDQTDSHGNMDLAENGVGVVLSHSDSVFGNVADYTGSGGSNLYLNNSAGAFREATFSSAFTIAGWVNFDTVSTDGVQCVACRADNGANTNAEIDWQLILLESGPYLEFYGLSGSTGYGASFSSLAISPATWYFYQAWYDPRGDVVGININEGTPVTTAMAGSMNTGGDQFKYGRRSFNGTWDAYMNGKHSRAALWNRLLADRESAWLYRPNNPRNYTDLQDV
jgi:hypothetical protein